MMVDTVALNAWINGAATWSLTGPLSVVESPGELWVATEDPDAVVRVASAQMPDEPEQVWTIGAAEAGFSSRPVQVGLVAILFVGAAVGVVLALAGVTGYVLLAVSRRAREMGVLRALGFERKSVGLTFALEQFVVIGLGAAIGVLGGVALVMVMLPFLQLGETAVVIEPQILISIPTTQLVAYIAVLLVLLIVSVLWATRRVSVRRMSEVLREGER
jgi:putative ABC transport system permease protein